MYKSILIALSLFATQASFAENEIKGIRPSYGEGIKVVPIDIETVDVEYTFDVKKKTAVGTAEILFNNLRDGYPSFDLERQILNARIGLEDVTGLLIEQTDPDAASKHIVLKKQMKKGTQTKLTIEFDLTPKVSFTKEAARVGFFMTDLRIGGRGFVEQYAPSNFEFDQMKYKFFVKVTGTDKEHLVFTNGDVEQLDFSTVSRLIILNILQHRHSTFTYPKKEDSSLTKLFTTESKEIFLYLPTQTPRKTLTRL